MSPATHKGAFSRRPRLVLAVVILLGLAALVAAAELTLRWAYGLGTPVLYQVDARFGFRPRPNQRVSRRAGVTVRINRLGLRAGNWGPGKQNKILFLGDSVTYGGSHVDNDALFSELAPAGLPGWRTGNAGVNAWGVANVHGLVVTARFTPATVYVTTLTERAFYRGFATINKLPYWCRAPRLALVELAYYWLHGRLELDRSCRRISRPQGAARGRGLDAQAEHAVARLGQLHRHLTGQGARHLIFVSPTRAQAVRGRPRDARVMRLLSRHGLPAVNLLDHEQMSSRSARERESWYYDHVHLTPAGHRAWAEMIRARLVTATSWRPR